jgi:TIR domain
MKIFLSHVSEDRSTAEAIAFSLRDRGHKVFLDRDDLPVGQGFDERIERAVKQSEIFIFLISPDSVTGGRYALTELLFARQKWPSPSGHVLPVRVRTTPPDQIPSYLKAVTILAPQGNVAAETSAKVDEMARHAEADFEEASNDTEPGKAVNPLWAFLGQRKNREILAWIGGGVVVVAAGLWAIFVYVFPPNKDASAMNAQANCGGVAIGGNVSGSTITAGSTTNSECSPKPK